MVHKYDLYYFSHNKFWIVDGKRVNLCTGMFVDGSTQVHIQIPRLNPLTADFDSGNWAPTDFPGPPHRYSHALFSPERTPQIQYPLSLPIPTHNFALHSYPPYGETGWRKTNRDFTLRVTDPQIVHLFRQAMLGA